MYIFRIFAPTSESLGQGRKKNRKLWGFYPKRREGVISETQFYYTFNLGHFREEGGGQKLNFSIFLINLIEKIPSKRFHFSKNS